MTTATEYRKTKAAQIQRLAAKGRKWLEAEGKELKAALARQTWEGKKDGTAACIAAELEDVRAAWKLAA